MKGIAKCILCLVYYVGRYELHPIKSILYTYANLSPQEAHQSRIIMGFQSLHFH